MPQATTGICPSSGNQPPISSSRAGSKPTRSSFAIPLSDEASATSPPLASMPQTLRLEVPQSTAIQTMSFMEAGGLDPRHHHIFDLDILFHAVMRAFAPEA